MTRIIFTPNKIEIKIPFVKEHGDYHDIPDLRDTLRSLAENNKLKSTEIGFNGMYVGLYYTGKKPDSKEIKALLAAANIEL